MSSPCSASVYAHATSTCNLPANTSGSRAAKQGGDEATARMVAGATQLRKMCGAEHVAAHATSERDTMI
jgi:hypothetical protein